MRATLLLLALAACGQAYSKPAAAPPPGSGPPGGDPWNDPPPNAEPVEGPVVEGPPAAAPPEAPRPANDAEAEPEAKGAGGSVADQWIAAHNKVRAKHCAPPLTWSKKLADVAQKWANTLKAKGCVFGHSGNPKYGENLGAGSIGALDPESTVAMWYDEVNIYHFPEGGFSMQTGHFTQLVWTDTRQVGCGHVQCKGNDIYVCNYDPPGNYDGEYATHVLPKSCKK